MITHFIHYAVVQWGHDRLLILFITPLHDSHLIHYSVVHYSFYFIIPLHDSGIMAIFVGGVIMSHYTQVRATRQHVTSCST